MCVCTRVEREDSVGKAVVEDSVTVSQRDADKTPVIELLQRLSDTDDAAQPQQLSPLQFQRMSLAIVIIIIVFISTSNGRYNKRIKRKT